MYIYFFFVLLLSSCVSIESVKLYDGPVNAREKDSILSSVGFYPERNLSIAVTAINGVAVNTTKTAEFQITPNAYKVKLRIYPNIKVINPKVTSEALEQEIELIAEENHTYIPNADITPDGTVKFKFDDAGKNYPQACLPLYKFASPSQGGSRGKEAESCSK